MKRSVRLRLNDIVCAIDGATDTMAGIEFHTFRTTFHVGRTLERCIEIVSEATRHIPDELKSEYPDIPWRQIAGIGSVLRHNYDIVDERIIWEIATVHFPHLRAAIIEMRSRLADDD
jgi:uncharacterized protein with HEPN domain